MSQNITTVRLSKLLSLDLEKVDEIKSLSVQQKNRFKIISTKIKPELVDIIISNLHLHIYVKHIKSALEDLSIENIIAVDKIFILYILKLYFIQNPKINDKDVTVIYSSNKKEYFIKSSFDFILNVVAYCKTGITLDQERIESIIPEQHRLSLFKGYRKSVLSTLLGVKSNNYYVAHPDSKYRIVYISELKSTRYQLSNGKYLNLPCPICKQSHRIDEKTVSKVLVVKNNILTFNCQHIAKDALETVVLQNPYTYSFLKHFSETEMKKLTVKEKQILFINNYKRITNGIN